MSYVQSKCIDLEENSASLAALQLLRMMSAMRRGRMCILSFAYFMVSKISGFGAIDGYQKLSLEGITQRARIEVSLSSCECRRKHHHRRVHPLRLPRHRRPAAQDSTLALGLQSHAPAIASQCIPYISPPGRRSRLGCVWCASRK